jgi:hypothetical protein
MSAVGVCTLVAGSNFVSAAKSETMRAVAFGSAAVAATLTRLRASERLILFFMFGWQENAMELNASAAKYTTEKRGPRPAI